MSIVSARAIDALWFLPGTAADAAACVNKYSTHLRYTADAIRRHWTRSQIAGRLPDLPRPTNGFEGSIALVMRRLGIMMTGREWA